MRFGLISQQIRAGNGIRVPIIRLEDSYVPVNGAIPFLDQVPLLAILFAIMGGLTPQNYFPAQAVNVISHVVMSVFTFLIAKNYVNKGIALLTGILVAFTFPLLRLTHHIWNEPLFIALTAAVIYFLIVSRNSEGPRFRRSIVAASICASAAVLTRNAGIALIPVLFWMAFVVIREKKYESKYAAILSLLLPLITTMGVFVRNYAISGSLRGFNQASPGRSYLSALAGTVDMIFSQFQLGRNGVVPIVVLMTVLLSYVLVNSGARKELRRFFNGGLDVIAVFILSYFSLICLTMAKQQWHYELRYVAPLVPFLFILSIVVIVLVWKMVRLQGFSRLSLIGMILSLGLITFGNCYKTFLNLPEFSYRQVKAYSILQSCTYKWIKGHYEENTVITTNRPYHLSFFGAYTTVALPHKRFNPTIHVSEDMESILPDRMAHFGSRVLALFDEAEKRYDGSYVTRLFHARGPVDRFVPAHACADGVIYVLKD
jgi:hypothetical protein